MTKQTKSVRAEVQPGQTRISLLGSFRMWTHGQRVGLPLGTQRLVAFVSFRGHAHREEIAATLWPDSDCRRAAHSLRNELWQASRLCPGVLVATDNGVELHEDVQVDLKTLARCLQTLTLAPAAVDLADLLEVPTQSELLFGWFEDWVLLERERARQQHLHYLEAAAAELQRRGEHISALTSALAAVRIEPLRESAHRAVIDIHLAEGNLAEAVRHYERLEGLLDTELGLRPSHAVRKLVQDALSQHWSPGPAGSPASSPSGPGPRTAAFPLIATA